MSLSPTAAWIIAAFAWVLAIAVGVACPPALLAWWAAHPIWIWCRERHVGVDPVAATVFACVPVLGTWMVLMPDHI